MTIKDLLNKSRSDFGAVLEFYKTDIGSIRTGRATPALVEDLAVEYYGQKMKVKEMASIIVPEPRSLLITPWDKAAVEAIVSAIRKSDIGLQPIAEGTGVRLNIPLLTEERRKEFIKNLKRKGEDARIKIRRAREEVWEKGQEMEKNGELREDDKFRFKEDLQKMTDEYNNKISELEKKKEGELMN